FRLRLQHPALQPFPRARHALQAGDAPVPVGIETLDAFAHALAMRRRVGAAPARVVVDVARLHQQLHVLLVLDARDPVLAEAGDAALAAALQEVVAPGGGGAPERAPGEVALVVDVRRIRVVVAPGVVLGGTRLLFAEQADPRVAEAAVAHAERVGPVGAVPRGRHAARLAEPAFIHDFVGRRAEPGHLDPHPARVRQRDHQFPGPGVVLQFLRQYPGDAGVGLLQGGTIGHQRTVARGQCDRLVVHPDPDDIALLAEDADL